ncbi:Spy/CpxP family protein refolding chaperone [Chitinispirillales bacterium ANBcel5]|uniref:Spy/CpxP family protein refolding chaperone n=1 Tax=Cellulosispirillum alkaliphilum TaxID=3039283 RepID=UPI002A598216|nr:Spy/CpxP family protein refolding chaperone [Chitinispirillales bacterium ANBcel5]
MKFSFAVAIALMVIVISIPLTAKTGKIEILEKRIDQVKSELDLTNEQKERIAPTVQEQKEQFMKLKENCGRTECDDEKNRRKRMGRCPEMRSFMAESRAKINAELTEQQQEQLDEMLRGMRQNKRQRCQGRERRTEGSNAQCH